MASPPPLADDSPADASSLNTLRLALVAMKERCQRHQRRIDELERENLQIRTSRGDLYKEVKKLHESNLRLREKNLQLNQRLHRKTRENVEVRDQLNSLQDEHSDSIRQLERLQTEVSTLAFSSSSSDLGVEAALRMEEEDMLASPVVSSSRRRREERDSEEAVAQMSHLKSRLLEQQAALKESMLRLSRQVIQKQHQEQQQQQQEAEAAAAAAAAEVAPRNVDYSEEEEEEEETEAAAAAARMRSLPTDAAASAASAAAASASAASAASADARGAATGFLRVCPMCEAYFPPAIRQEDFEAHVVEHFSYEESETLRNFDLVPDHAETPFL